MLTIRTIEVTGGETIDHTRVQQAIEMVLEGEYIGLVPRRFAWWYPEDDVLATVQQIPRVKDPVVNRVNGTTLRVTFAEYIPHALWCDHKDSDHCLFIDEVGYAFTEAPQLSGGAFPRFHTIGTTPTVGQVMLLPADLVAIEQLRSHVTEKLRLPVAYVETDMMRDVFMGIAGGGEIKASLRYTPAETLSNLETILTSNKLDNLTPGNFEYIDLRFGDKVFVNKYGAPVATSSATTTLETMTEPLIESATTTAAE
jgi:cell division septal protein FtsQ